MVRSPMADAPTSPRSRASRTSQTRCARSLPWLKCRYARLLCSTQQCVLHVSSSAARPGSHSLQLPARTVRLEDAAATGKAP